MANRLKNFNKDIKQKRYFLNSLGLLFRAREKFLIAFKAEYFQKKFSTHEPAEEPEVSKEQATEPEAARRAKKGRTKCKISSWKLREEFLNKIKNKEKYINGQIFKYFFYQTLLYLA